MFVLADSIGPKETLGLTLGTNRSLGYDGIPATVPTALTGALGPRRARNLPRADAGNA
jgi:hypothetical protein